MTMLENLQGKRGKMNYHENFLYKINKKTTQKIYLECNRRCGTRMIVDSNITDILSLPTPQSHPEESLDDLTMEKIRQKMRKRLKKDPTQNLKKCFRQRFGRKSETTGPWLQISKKQPIPNQGKKSSIRPTWGPFSCLNFFSIFFARIFLALWYPHWRKMGKNFGWQALFVQTWCINRC